MIAKRWPYLAVGSSLAGSLLVSGAAAGVLRRPVSRVAQLASTYTVTDGSVPDSPTYTITPDIVSDGERYAVFLVGKGSLQVFDSKSNALSPPIAIDQRCGPVVAADGLAVISCEPDNSDLPNEPAPSILDLARQVLRTVPGGFAGGDQPVGVGRYWIQIRGCGFPKPEVCVGFYVNWRTGRRLSRSGKRNLDSSDLAPSSRPQKFLFDRHVNQLWLQDGDRQIRLSRCETLCFKPMLSAGRATWTQGLEVYGYLLRNGRRIMIRASPCSKTQGLSATHTRYRLLISECDGNQPPGSALFQATW